MTAAAKAVKPTPTPWRPYGSSTAASCSTRGRRCTRYFDWRERQRQRQRDRGRERESERGRERDRDRDREKETNLVAATAVWVSLFGVAMFCRRRRRPPSSHIVVIAPAATATVNSRLPGCCHHNDAGCDTGPPQTGGDRGGRRRCAPRVRHACSPAAAGEHKGHVVARGARWCWHRRWFEVAVAVALAVAVAVAGAGAVWQGWRKR